MKFENNFKQFGYKGNFCGSITTPLRNGGYLGTVEHRGVTVNVIFNSDGRCFDIYADLIELIQWDKYNLKRIKNGNKL